MSPGRETGNSSMLMVLMLLLSGAMMLVGLASHLTVQQQWGIQETRSIVRYAGAQSAMSWGMWQSWWPQKQWQCQTEMLAALRACVYQLPDNEAVMAGFLVDDHPAGWLVHWRLGRLKKGKFIASAHGWLDYCPLNDKTQCNLAS